MKRVDINFSSKLGPLNKETETFLFVSQPQNLDKILHLDLKLFCDATSNVYRSIIDSCDASSKLSNKGMKKDILSSEKYFPLLLDREGGLLVLPPGASRHDCSNRPHVLTKFLKGKQFFNLRYSLNSPSSLRDKQNVGQINGNLEINNTHSDNLLNGDGSEADSIKNGNKEGVKPGISKLHLVIVCDYANIISYAIAVARAYPAFHAKSCKVTATNHNEKGTTSSWVNSFMPRILESVSNKSDNNNPLSPSSTAAVIIKQEVSVTFLIVTNDAGTLANDKQKSSSPSQDYRFVSEQDINMLNQMVYGVRLTSILVDMPCNILSTNEFIQEIQRIGTELGIVPKIIRGTELELKGFGGLFGVGKAAINPPALVTLSHEPANSKFNIAWVGKGIVYDTGGLSLKGKGAMCGMKRDCGGAAAILGAFYACVKLGFAHCLHAVFCLAENSIGPNATRPDDIHTMYSGKTVEINNTDAEGRLVLADGVAFASRDLKCDIILDMATLTGAQGIATGKYHGALITNDGLWEDYCYRAGKVSGDLIFPLPYCPELHFSEFSSSLADMKNSVGDRGNAQSSCAGLFIASHLKKGFEFPGVWLHVDMASPVHSGERATGYGVGLLLTLFGFGSHDTYLNSHCPVSADVLLKQSKYFKALHAPLANGGKDASPKLPYDLAKLERQIENIDILSNLGKDNSFGMVGVAIDAAKKGWTLGGDDIPQSASHGYNNQIDVEENINSKVSGNLIKNTQQNFPNFNDEHFNYRQRMIEDEPFGDKKTSLSIHKSILLPNAKLSSSRKVTHRSSEPVIKGGY